MDTNKITTGKVEGKVDKVEYIAAKVKTTLSRKGKPISHKGAYVYRFRVDGAWLLTPEAIAAGAIPAEAEVISGTMGLLSAKANFHSAFDFAGLECPKSLRKASEEAAAQLAAAEIKREEKRRATWEAGESSFLAREDERAAAKWRKLDDEYSSGN